MSDLQEREERCIRYDVPICADKCPFGFDPRQFVDKLAKGSVAAAFGLYQKAVLFPDIVSRICTAPCEKVCFRGDVDAPVCLGALERGVCALTKDRASGRFFVSDKKKSLLVVGGGLSGCAAAIRLAKRGYTVTLLEQRRRLGGRLWDMPNEVLPKSIIQEELTRSLENRFLTIEYGCRVTGLEEYDFDAAVIAAGAESAGLEADGRDGVFFIGSARDPGADPIGALVDGMNITSIIDAYIQGAARPMERSRAKSRYIPKTDKWEPEQPVIINMKEPDREAVIAEAARCKKCTCSECMEVCEPMSAYYQDPKKVLADISGALNKNDLSTKKAQRFINSCTLCGLCEKVCPQNIDFGELCRFARQELHRKNDMPKVYHEFWLEDMKWASGSDAGIVRMPKGAGSVSYAFFPGCQMAGSDPLYVTESYRFLLEKLGQDVAIFQHCCGMPAYWAGREEEFAETLASIRDHMERLGKPKLILACASCRRVFQKYLPEAELLSLWDVLGDFIDMADPKHSGTLAVFDPCSTREAPEIQKKIRDIITGMGFNIEELSFGREDARCCGFGGSSYLANEELFHRNAKAAAEQSGEDYVTYCVNCRDCFAAQGKSAYHILDLVFFGDASRKDRKPPGPNGRRANRAMLRKQLLAEFFGEEAEQPAAAEGGLKLHFTDVARASMERRLIIEDKVRQVIEHGFSTGRIVEDRTFGCCYCHQEIGALTYYAKFIDEGDGRITVLDAYYHRTGIMEAENAK